MPHEDLHLLSHHALLLTMAASVNEARDTVRRTLELIEQSRIMLRELDIHGGRRPTNLVGRARPGSVVQPTTKNQLSPSAQAPDLNATLPRLPAAPPAPPG